MTASLYILSVEPFSITIPTGATSQTYTLSNTLSDLTRATIEWGGYTTTYTGSDGGQFFSSLEITDSTTVTARRGESDATFTVTVYGTVVQYSSLLMDRVQRGTVVVANGTTSGTASVTTMGALSSLKTCGFYTTTDTGGMGFNTNFCRLDKQDATTIRARRSTLSVNTTVNNPFVLKEWNSATVESVQAIDITLTGTNTTDTFSLSGNGYSSVVRERTLIDFSGQTSSLAGFGGSSSVVSLIDNDTIEIKRTTGTSATRMFNFDLVQLKSGVIQSIQRGLTTISSSSPATIPITPVDTARSFFGWCNQTGLAGIKPDDLFLAQKMKSDGTAEEVYKNTLTTTLVGSWEVYQLFAPATVQINGANILGANIL